MLKYIVITLCVSCVLFSCARNNVLNPGATEVVMPSTKSAGMRESLAADLLCDAIIMSGDMCIKMPVLADSFLDNPDWEVRLQGLIRRENWVFAKLHFIHFYIKNVTSKNAEFVLKMQKYTTTNAEALAEGDSLGIVDEILKYKTP